MMHMAFIKFIYSPETAVVSIFYKSCVRQSGHMNELAEDKTKQVIHLWANSLMQSPPTPAE
jgi:hypothetical protein